MILHTVGSRFDSPENQTYLYWDEPGFSSGIFDVNAVEVSGPGKFDKARLVSTGFAGREKFSETLDGE